MTGKRAVDGPARQSGLRFSWRPAPRRWFCLLFPSACSPRSVCLFLSVPSADCSRPSSVPLSLLSEPRLPGPGCAAGLPCRVAGEELLTLRLRRSGDLGGGVRCASCRGSAGGELGQAAAGSSSEGGAPACGTTTVGSMFLSLVFVPLLGA